MKADFLIVGGGIAGASVAAHLAGHGRVVVLEREAQPGYHSTGRSAALFIESYGPQQVRALTCASRAFFENPPEGFAEHPLLARRGTLTVAREDQLHLLDAQFQQLGAAGHRAERLSASQARALVPVLRPEATAAAMFDPSAADMDVNAILQGYLRMARRAGAIVACDCKVRAAERKDGLWRVHTTTDVYEAPVLVNAAGAWADVVAQLAGVRPFGIEPRRRAAFIFVPPEGMDVRAWPMVLGAAEDWYFKPEAELLFGSPANADPVEPHDVRPEELDIAQGIDRIEAATTLAIRRPAHTWAGLRSFAPDGDMVVGFDDEAENFFWLAGQGGYGIQTSAAVGKLAATLLMRQRVPDTMTAFGIREEAMRVDRLRAAPG